MNKQKGEEWTLVHSSELLIGVIQSCFSHYIAVLMTLFLIDTHSEKFLVNKDITNNFIVFQISTTTLCKKWDSQIIVHILKKLL